MPHRPTLAFALLATAAMPMLALAQERPPEAPTRDVAITYRLLGPHPGTMQMRVQAGTGLTRMDNPDHHGYGIVDRTRQQMTMVMTEEHSYMVMTSPPGAPRTPELDPTARFTRHGTDTVAGLSCTVWDYTSRHSSGSACVTDDGVMLRTRDNASQLGMEAIEVTYAAQPDADFHPPAGFTQMQMPQFAPGMPGMPPGRPPAH